ncbi:hypothetical protein HY992_02205 [Candidatus Micrarchaeota archaeon]|nr:hypothetical protein [Candidatus Micrarchaeota archaeon]
MASKTTTRGGKAGAPKPRGRQAEERGRQAREAPSAVSTFFHRLHLLAKTNVSALVPRIGKGWVETAFSVDTAGLLANERDQYTVGSGFRELINNIFDAGGTKCDIVVDTANNQVIITGNGTPIRDIEELSVLFSARKRNAKVVADIDGNPRVIIGEKGRGRLAASVDCDEVWWTSECGEFKIEFGEGENFKIASKGKPSKEVQKGKTVVVMKRDASNPYDEKWIRAFLSETYKYFEGLNFSISLNGTEIPMQEFKPTNMIIVAPENVEVSVKTSQTFKIYGMNYHVVDAEVTEGEVDEFLVGTPCTQLVSIQHDLDMPNGRELLALHVPVSRENYGCGVGKFIVDSTFTLRPDRHSFAEWRDGTALMYSNVSFLLQIATNCAFAMFLNSGKYVELGWNKLDNERYGAVLHFIGISEVEDYLKLPDLEVSAFAPQPDGTAKRVVTTLGQLQSTSQKVVILDAKKVAADRIPELVHQGRMIVLTEKTELIEQLLKNLGVKTAGEKSAESRKTMRDIDKTTKFALKRTLTSEEANLARKLKEACVALGCNADVAVVKYVGGLENKSSVVLAENKICIVTGTKEYAELIATVDLSIAKLMLTVGRDLMEAIAETKMEASADGAQSTEQLRIMLFRQRWELVQPLLEEIQKGTTNQ